MMDKINNIGKLYDDGKGTKEASDAMIPWAQSETKWWKEHNGLT